MKYPLICTVLLVLWSAPGCQNQELIQCRQEKQDLQTQLEKSELRLKETVAMYDEMFKLIEEENEKLKQEVQTMIKPKQDLPLSKLEETVKTLRQQLDERTRQLLMSQQENKKLQARIKELEKKIKK